MVAMSPSNLMISPTSSECPTRTNSYIAAPDIFCAVTTTRGEKWMKLDTYVLTFNESIMWKVSENM